jgi:hypothetical protein
LRDLSNLAPRRRDAIPLRHRWYSEIEMLGISTLTTKFFSGSAYVGWNT